MAKEKSFQQDVEVRLATEDDVAALLEIREQPLVAAQQYRFAGFRFTNAVLQRLNAPVNAESFEWQISAILFQKKVVGNITEIRTNWNSGFSVELGWNLHPDYWGRGLMTFALKRFIENLASDRKCVSIQADCFAHNERCLRLLKRLGFQETRIGAIERLLIWGFRLCPHRILRHRIENQ